MAALVLAYQVHHLTNCRCCRDNPEGVYSYLVEINLIEGDQRREGGARWVKVMNNLSMLISGINPLMLRMAKTSLKILVKSFKQKHI